MLDPPSPHLSPPPRPVPGVLTARLVLGGVFNQVGWMLLLFSLLFLWIFDPGHALGTTVRFLGDVETTEGVVSGWRETSLEMNDRPVHETRYDFEVGGRSLAGISYATGTHLEAGTRVLVEYVAADPSISRIEGMRTSAAGAWISFLYILPFLGMGMVWLGMRKGLKARRLMSSGRLGHGRLRSKEPTNMRVNNQTVYRMTFEFAAEGGGTYEVVGHTHRTLDLEDEPEERLVYDPRHPSDAALLDELPCRPGIDARGNFVAEGSRQYTLAALNLVLPVLALIGYLAYVRFR